MIYRSSRKDNLTTLGGIAYPERAGSLCWPCPPAPCNGDISGGTSQQLEEGAKIAIEGPWSRESPGIMALSGIAYMTIHNEGETPDKLIAGKTDFAEAVEFHSHTTDENGVMRMRMVEGGAIEIPAGRCGCPGTRRPARHAHQLDPAAEKR